jgi:formyltetrahydrofolate-dependent phosphoribosylglycinamide formyltransferase
MADPPRFPRIAVLISGSGTNLQAIIDDNIPVTLVLSDRVDAHGLERAKKAGIATRIVDRSDYKNQREEFTARVIETLQNENVELVILAGFMSILTDNFVTTFENRVLNIHPSLLPAFRGTYGKGTMTATLESGVKVTGCTVHIVTTEVDAGPILSQESVEVLDNDDEESLHERIQKVEHRLYPQTIRQFCAEHFTKESE